MPRRPVAIFLAVLVVLVIAVGGGLILFRLPLAEALLRRGLATQGIEPAAFTVAELGLHDARLTGIALGSRPEVEIAELQLAYSPRTLLAGLVDGIDVTGLRLRLDLTGMALPLGSLQGLLEGAGAAGEAAPPLPLVRMHEARIEAATPAGPVAVEFSGDVAPQGDGRLQADFDLTLTAALGARVAGRLTAAGDPAAGLGGTLTVTDGALELAATEVSGAQGEIRFRLHALEPESIAGHLALGQLALEGTEVPGAVLEIDATPTGARLIARASAGDGTLDAELQAEVEDPTGAPRLRATSRASVDLAAPVVAALWPRFGVPRPDGGRAELRLQARADAPADRQWQLLNVELDVDLDVAGLAAAGVSIPAGRLRLPLALTAQDTEAAVRLRSDGSFQLTGPTLRSGRSGLRAVEALAGDVTALDVTLRRGPAGGVPKVAIALRPQATTLEIAPTDATPLELELAGQRLGVVYGPDQAGDPALHLSLADGRVAARDYAVAAETVLLAADLGPSLALRRADFVVGALRHLGSPPAFAPWSLSGSLLGRGETIHLDATAKGPQDQGRIAASGDLRPADGSGRLALSLAPLSLAEAGPTPATFVPALKAIRGAHGTVSATAEVQWGAAQPTARARLVLDDLAFTAPGVRVAGLALDLTLDRLFPPATPQGQRLRVARIDPGIPLSDLDLRFHILPGTPPSLVIGTGKVAVIGGELSLADVTLDPAAERVAVPVTAERLDLAALFRQLDVEGLAGDGQLSGRIPLVFSGANLAVDGGHLAAQGPGSLRIHSDAARKLLASGGESTELVLNALEDFHYTELTLDVAKELTADPHLTLSMLGSNPVVLEGHPIRFNVNLEGRTGPLLESLSEAYRLSNSLLLQIWRPR